MKIYPVIHYLHHDLALEQAALAQRLGAHGVFLISHRAQDQAVLEAAVDIRRESPEFRVGVNLLNHSALDAAHLALSARLGMIWADAMGVSSAGATEEGRQLSAWARLHQSLEFFAGVAFKYQSPEPLPVEAARQAIALGFTPTTSGAATGVPPELSRIQAMSEAVGGRLAVASGMTVANIAEYAPYLSACLVATGVALDEHHIDPEKLAQFLERAAEATAKASVQEVA